MNTRTVRTLAIVAIMLMGVMIVIEMGEDDAPPGSGELLLPELKDRINDIDRVAFRDADGTISIVNDGESWTVAERAGFPADVGKLREVLLALADARTLEQKTSNPDRYAQLGLDDPENEDSKAVAVEISGDGFDYSVIVGNRAQRNHRYVRVAGADETWMIDTNPDVPDDAGGWLMADIIDVDSKRVRSVTITHPDGETITAFKEDAENANFDVDAIPEGRELSYPSVANGMGGVLNELRLDDVRQAVELSDPVITQFLTFDGLQVTVHTEKGEEETWIELAAAAVPLEQPAEEEEKEEKEQADDAASDSGEDDEPADESEEEAAPEYESADAINARVGGWQYRIADYKANLLLRRWDDILKAAEEDSDE